MTGSFPAFMLFVFPLTHYSMSATYTTMHQSQEFVKHTITSSQLRIMQSSDLSDVPSNPKQTLSMAAMGEYSTGSEARELAIIPAEASIEGCRDEQVSTPVHAPRGNHKLPDRIYAEFSVRTHGASAGKKDWHYMDLQTGKKFRSKKEALEYLDKEQEDYSTDTTPTFDTVVASARAWKPESVTWVLPGNISDEPIPYVNGAEVPKEIRKVWAEDFERQLQESQRLSYLCMAQSTSEKAEDTPFGGQS